MLYIAVVCRGQEKPVSGGANGGWSSFIGPFREEGLMPPPSSCAAPLAQLQSSLV